MRMSLWAYARSYSPGSHEVRDGCTVSGIFPFFFPLGAAGSPASPLLFPSGLGDDTCSGGHGSSGGSRLGVAVAGSSRLGLFSSFSPACSKRCSESIARRIAASCSACSLASSRFLYTRNPAPL